MKTYTTISETRTVAGNTCRKTMTFVRRIFMVTALLLCSLLTFAQNKSLSSSIQGGGVTISYTLHGDYVVETVSTDTTKSTEKIYVVRVKPNTELRAELSVTKSADDRAWGHVFVWDDDKNQLIGDLINKNGHSNYKFRLKENAHININCCIYMPDEGPLAANLEDFKKKHLKNDISVKIKCYASDSESESVTVEREGSEITTASKDDMEQGNVDSEYLSGWEIPVGVAVIVFGLGSAAAVFSGGRKDENGGGDDDENAKEEPLNENPNLAWRMMKEFGDKLFVGDNPQTIAAKIVQVKNGADIPLDHLTQLIQITSPDCFEVSNMRWLNGFMAADIRVKPGVALQQVERGGHANFTLAANGASITYSMRFDIVCPTLEINDMNVILGDGMVYQTWIRLDSMANPKELRVLSHPYYEVVEQPVRMDGEWGDQGYYTVQILNKTNKSATNVIEWEKADYDPVEVSVEAEFEGGLVVPGVVRIYEYPEGMFFMVEKTTEGYADIQTDNARDRIVFGMNTVVRIPTDMRVYFSKYDAENKMAYINKVKQLKVAGDVKGQGKYEEGLSRDFGFTIEDYCGSKFGFKPLTTLAMESKDKPYMAELPLTGVVDYGEYGNDCVEGTLTMALYGLVPYKRTSWDDECDRLLKIITMFELQGDTNVRRTWESRKFYSANELHLFSRALLEEAVQYHTMQSMNYNTQAAWLSCGLACCHLLNYAGDQATEILLKHYFGNMGALVASPFLQLLKALAGKLTARYIDGKPLLPTSDDKDAAWVMYYDICNGIITNEMTKWLENPQKVGGLIAVFMCLNTAKHYWFDEDKTNRGDFWIAVLSSCKDLFKESSKQAVGKVLENCLKQIDSNKIENLSKWFGEKMKADEKLRKLVIEKLEDIVKNNPVQSVIPTLYEPLINAIMSDETENTKFDTDLFYSILVPDKDNDSSLEDYWIAIDLLLTAATHRFASMLDAKGMVSTEVRIARKRKENEAYS